MPEPIPASWAIGTLLADHLLKIKKEKKKYPNFVGVSGLVLYPIDGKCRELSGCCRLWWTCGFCAVRIFMCMYPLKQCKLTTIPSEAEFDHKSLMRERIMYIFYLFDVELFDLLKLKSGIVYS